MRVRQRNRKTQTITRAIAYVRVSTDKQAEHGVSLEAQRAKVEAYAAIHDLELVAVVEDAGESAKSLARPGLERALAAMAAGEADALLVVKLDRLTRSVTDLNRLVERCQREGWALLSVSESIDTRTAAGRLVLNVLGSVAQWEREAMRERGQYTGGQAPYGTRLVGAELVPDEGEQAVIALARELRASGLSLRDVRSIIEGQRP